MLLFIANCCDSAEKFRDSGQSCTEEYVHFLAGNSDFLPYSPPKHNPQPTRMDSFHAYNTLEVKKRKEKKSPFAKQRCNLLLSCIGSGILASQSTYFRCLFNSGMQEATASVLDVGCAGFVHPYTLASLFANCQQLEAWHSRVFN